MRKAFTLVELLTVIAVIAVVIAVLLPAVQMAREAARRIQCTNHQKNLATAILHHEDAKRGLPGWRDFISVNYKGDEVAAHASWVFQILPFIEQTSLYDSLKKNQPGAAAAIQPIAILFCPSYSGPTENRNRSMNYVVNAGGVDDFSATDPWVTTDGNVANGPFLDRANIVAGVIKNDGQCPCGGGSQCRYNRNLGKYSSAVAKLSDISSMDGTANTLLLSENLQRGFWIAEEIVHFYNDRNGNSRPIDDADWSQHDGRWYVKLTGFAVATGGDAITGDTIEGSVGFCWPRDYYDLGRQWKCEIAYFRDIQTFPNGGKRGFTAQCEEQEGDDFTVDRDPYDAIMAPCWINMFSKKSFTVSNTPRMSGSWYSSARPSSHHSGIVVAAFCDGNIQRINQNIDERVFVGLMVAGAAQSDAGWSFRLPDEKNFIE